MPESMRTTERRGPGALARTLLALLAALVLASVCGHASADAEGERRVIVLGFDGMDFELTSSLMAAGKLPNFSRLAKEGRFGPLGTSVPPQSPVAWSDVITGHDAGGHGIFDFIHRDPASMVPYLSTARTTPGSGPCFGRFKLPLRPGKVELLRHGTAFWERLGERGIETTIVRMPANFPPSGTATRELSGMGTPDLLGSYGTFTFFTTDDSRFRGKNITGGRVLKVRPRGGVIDTYLEGPENPFICDKKGRKKEHVRSDLKIYLDPEAPLAKIVAGDEEVVLAQGEWSRWMPVDFSFVPTQSVRAITRFYLKSVRPVFQLYATPLNHDPLDPAAPISSPDSFATELARATGRYYTQGMPEDTKALTESVLTPDEFLQQARLAGDEVIEQYGYVLDRFERGLLFYYFGNLDQISHMMWRSRDPQHPAYDAEKDARFSGVIEGLYVQMDGIVGQTLAAIGPETTLIVMSDHGFTSWRRSFNLNTWLHENGYLALLDSSPASKPSLFKGVDWSRTRAYGLGINSLYLNISGREKYGAVPEAAREALLDEIEANLLSTIDPATGRPAVTRVYRQETTFEPGELRDGGPDLIVGYAKGTRCSNPSVLGEIEKEVFSDNTSWWSGDHCMDHETVPGILGTSRPLAAEVLSLRDLAGAIAAEFGVNDAAGR